MSKEDSVTLYKYMPLKYAADAIKNGRLYLNNGTNTNDPFEITVIDKKNQTTRRAEGLHILCLTNGFRNRLMWPHYAESHKGVCLTVEVPQSLLYPICYTSKRVFENSDLDEIIKNSKKTKKKTANHDYSLLSIDKKLAYIKSTYWDYECELRVVFDKEDEEPFLSKKILEKSYDEENKCDNWFMKVNITNVYLGVGFKDDYIKKDDEVEAQKDIIKVCKSQGIQTTQMKLSNSSYKLIKDE